MVTAVHDNSARGRYELQVGDALAFIDYHRDGGVVIMAHAEVPSALRGGGIGSQLVAGALARVREQGEKVVPLCPFVEAYIRRHPEAQDLLAGSGGRSR